MEVDTEAVEEEEDTVLPSISQGLNQTLGGILFIGKNESNWRMAVLG